MKTISALKGTGMKRRAIEALTVLFVGGKYAAL
jgi:hypothetical protein